MRNVLHDGLSAGVEARGDYPSQGKHMAWMMTIVRNLAMDHLRVKVTYPFLEIGGGPLCPAGPAFVTAWRNGAWCWNPCSTPGR